MLTIAAIIAALPSPRECAEVCRRCGERRGRHYGLRGQWCRPGYIKGLRRTFVASGRYQTQLGQLELGEVT